MAEPRRIAFETVKPTQKDKNAEGRIPTPRFSLRLCKSDDKSYSEYSYSELVKSVSKKGVEENGEKDPFGDSMDDSDAIMAMAKKFEDKYGPKPAKRKRQEHWEDFVDKGLGYDETDPFIDNDEAYDELVPSSITTQHGGFYINLGELEFRAVSSDSEPFPYDPTKKRKKKKKMKDLFEKAKRKKRAIILDDEDIELMKKKGKKLLDASSNKVENTLQIEAKKKVKVAVAEVKEENPPVATVNNNHLPMVSANSISPTSDDSDFETAKDTSFVASCLSDMEGDVEETEQVKNPNEQPQDIPKLPLNMPSDLDSCVNKLKQAASISDEGKCKFFTIQVNDMLLNVELKSRQLSKSHRSMIYAHLASHLPCTKETLQKRAKKLTVDQEDGKLRKPLEKLREAVAIVMPAQKEKYAAECETAAAAELAAEKSENKETKGENEDDKKSRVPRRKFAWANEIRSLLCEVVSAKLKCFEVMKVRTQTVEEFLRQFFEMEVKDLWPTGWMNSRILMRESKSVYMHLSKAKKLPTVPRKPIPSVVPVSNAPLTITNSVPVSSVGPIKSESVQIVTTSPLTSIKNTSFTQFSETAALPSISKLIQQTKVSSFPAISTSSSVVGVVTSLISSPDVKSVPKTTDSATNLSFSILSSNHKTSPESNKQSSISIKPVLIKADAEKILETGQSKQLPKNNMFVTETSKQTTFSKPVKGKPDSAKSPMDVITSAGTRTSSSLKVTKSSFQPSLMSVITSTTMSSIHKEPSVPKESTAFDVLDQIINASLGNFSSNKTDNDLFSSGPSKLVDNALMDLMNSQPQKDTSVVAHQTHNLPSRTLSSESLPHVMPQSRPTPVVSIVKTSPLQQTLPNTVKSHSRSNNVPSNSESFCKSIIKNTSDNLLKPYGLNGKFLSEIPHSQPISVTPVQNVLKNRPIVSSSSPSLSTSQCSPASSSSLLDPAANLRSSYGFHEAFLNSLGGTSREPPESQNVLRYPKSANNKNLDYKDNKQSNAQTSSGIMKKQDFFSHNRVVNYSHSNEDVPVTGNAYTASPISRTSSQSVEKLKNSIRHHNTFPKQTVTETVFSTSPESIGSLHVEKQKKPHVSPNIPQYGNSKNFIQSTSDFSQDRLVSGLLHHASFTNEKLPTTNCSIPKSSMKSDNFIGDKHQPQSSPHSEKESSRSSSNSVSHPSIHHSQHKRSEELVPHSTSLLHNKPMLTSAPCNNLSTSPTFKQPSPQTSTHQNFHPQSKSPSLQPNQTSPYNKFGATHLAKPYTHSQHQPSSGVPNPVMLPTPGNRIYQTSPTSSASHHHPLPSLMPQNSPVYSQIPNVFGNQTSPQVSSPQHSIIAPPVVSSPYNSQNITGYTQHSPSHRQMQ